jgi:uncharacterized repeat protein (TIGR01451 family)
MKKTFFLILPFCLLLFLLIHSITFAKANVSTVNEKFSDDSGDNISQIGPPWYDPAWHYRTPIIISSGSLISYYHVLITLDIADEMDSFIFAHTLPDGSDIRFTDSSGKNLLSYWIESWDNQKAYVWVLVSSILPHPYHQEIYLYYGNPNATSISNGASTFDFFDDFTQFSMNVCGLNINQQNSDLNLKNLVIKDGVLGLDSLVQADPWCVISGTPSVSNSYITLPMGTGIKTFNTFNNNIAMGFQAKYNSAVGNKDEVGFINGTSGPQTVIGDYPNDQKLYLINSTNDMTVPLGGSWHNLDHTYEIRWIPGNSSALIDHLNSYTNAVQVPIGPLPITLYNNSTSSGNTLDLHWVYVRKYQSPEPTYELDQEQGLVDLKINLTDSPDPLPTGKNLTYQISVNNISNIDAKEVVVTDTLPVDVTLVNSNSPLGCTNMSSTVICQMDNIAAGSSSAATIVVKPTSDGIITNIARVGSSEYELDLSNNNSQQTTLVDSVLPVVNWVAPVSNRQIYYATENQVMLEVTATDNDNVDRVEFWRYQGNVPIFIGTVNTPPYIYQFNIDDFVPNMPIPVEAFAYDRAGNKSSIESDERQVIYIERIYMYLIYLPLTIR